MRHKWITRAWRGPPRCLLEDEDGPLIIHCLYVTVTPLPVSRERLPVGHSVSVNCDMAWQVQLSDPSALKLSCTLYYTVDVGCICRPPETTSSFSRPCHARFDPTIPQTGGCFFFLPFFR